MTEATGWLAGTVCSRGGRDRSRRAALALALVASLAAPAQAQEASGRLIGRVVSEETGDPIPGAQVGLETATVGALTNADGQFLIRQIPPGTHAVVVQVIGYATTRVEGVVVEPGSATTLEVGVAPEAVALEGVTARAAIDRGSTTAVLTERRAAGVVSDAIGAEQIARAPDGDAAAVLARTPGVSIVGDRDVHVRGLGGRYGSASLNGSPLPSPEPDRKTVPLDLVPSSFLESIVTTKTYSPDQPGDYAGGLVEIRTRGMPAQRILKLGLGTSYSTTASFAQGLGYDGGDYDFLAFDDGTRDLPGGLPAERLTGARYTAAQLEDIGEAFSGTWGPNPVELPMAQSFSLAVGDDMELMDGDVPVGYLLAVRQSTDYTNHRDLTERVFSGAGAAEPEVDYNGTSSTRSASLGGLFNLTVEPAPDHRVSLEGLYSRTSDDGARILTGYNHDFGTNQRNTRIRYLVQELLGGQVRGEHEVDLLGDTRVDWRGSYSIATRYEPNTREVLYRQADDGRYLFDTFVQSGSIFHSDLREHAYGVEVGVDVPWTVRNGAGSVSFGAAADYKDRGAYARRFRFLPVGYVPEEVAVRQPDDLFTPETIGPSGFEIQEATFPGDNYEGDQEVLAAYGMLDVELFPRLRLVGGVRVERATQNVQPLDRFTTTNQPLPPARAEQTDVLPGVNLTWSATDAMKVRLAASRTLARPQFRELAPFQFTDYAGGFLTIGNPALERSRITNYDARWEWYPGLGSLVAVSGFYKRFESPIENAVLASTELLQTWVNADHAVNYGAELEVRASLAPIAAALRHVEVNGNLMLVESEVVTGDSLSVFLPFGAGLSTLAMTGRDRPLQGQSPFVLNLGLSYDHPGQGTTLSVLYNHFGRRIDAVSGGSLPDMYEEGRGTLDLVLEQSFPNGLSARLGAESLLGSEVEFTQGDGVVRSYDRGRVLSLSVSWDLGG